MKKLFTLFILLVAGHLPLYPQTAPQALYFEGISCLSVTLDDYDVRIRRSAGNKVAVRDSHRDNSYLEVVANDGTIEIHQRMRNGMFARTPQLDIEVPENMAYIIRMNTGDLSISQVAGSFKVSSKKGDIRAFISPTGASHFESEKGTVTIKLDSQLQANLHIGTGSGRGTLDFSKHPISARFTLDSFYPGGTIKAPFEFKEVHITHTYGPDSIVMRTEIGASQQEVSMSTGGGILQIIQ